MKFKKVKGTHFLSRKEQETGQNRERKPASERHSRTVQQSKGQVRTAKESLPARGTHPLSSAERWTDKDCRKTHPARDTHLLSCAEQQTGHNSERKSASKGHSPPVQHRARGWSGQRKKAG
jgi:hypothetical protein